MNHVGSFGWVRNEAASRAYTATLSGGAAFWDKLREADDGGDRFWYRALTLCLRRKGDTRWIKEHGGQTVLVSWNQGQVGSCVGHGQGLETTLTSALDIYMRGEPEAFQGIHSPEWAYYASRVEAGMIGRGDGSTGTGAAKSSNSLGTLVRGTYGGVDCSEYSESRCRSWGDGKSIPQAAKDAAKQHKTAEYVAVDTAEKVWLCAGAGLPYNQCSDIGWESARDADGACRVRGSWPHSMLAGSARYTTKSGRKLVLIHQSWGDDWTSGPYYSDQPLGSFYVDLEAAAEAASQGDTFVNTGYGGYVSDLPADFTQM